MWDLLDGSSTTSQSSSEGLEIPKSVNSVICPAIHHDLSVVKELVHHSNLTVGRMFDKVQRAHRAGE